jgi:23S rRNA pseudouridine1911/1915/1917 synthase
MALYAETVRVSGAMRLDRYIAMELKIVSRSQLKSRLVSLQVNGKDVKPSRLVVDGDRFVVMVMDEEDRSQASLPEDIPLSVIHEDDQVIVIDKPQGMVTHPAHGNWHGTLANALLGRYKSASEPPPRAGIVHRLDKDTSGVLIAGKNVVTQEFLAAQFRDRTTAKTYLALVTRQPAAEKGRLDSWLARDQRERKRFAPSPAGTGKHAVTDWRVVARTTYGALLELKPRTGRTHQLRVHCREMGCPILGDPLYGSPDRRMPDCTLMLHAYELRILLPGAAEPHVFRAPVPPRMLAAAQMLGFTAFPGQYIQ